MPKVAAALTGLAVAVVLLTGCAATASPSETPEVVEATETPDMSAQRLVAESPEPDANDPDAVFLTYVREELPPSSGITDATDESLIAAGHDACDQIRAGVALEDLRLVEGEQPDQGGYYLDTSAIFNGAITAYCPDAVEWPEG